MVVVGAMVASRSSRRRIAYGSDYDYPHLAESNCLVSLLKPGSSDVTGRITATPVRSAGSVVFVPSNLGLHIATLFGIVVCMLPRPIGVTRMEAARIGVKLSFESSLYGNDY
jgi:hypothetical protein